MTERERTVKRNIIKTAREIRKKFLELKRGLHDEEVALRKSYEPIVQPVKEILTKIKENPKPITFTSTPFPFTPIKAPPPPQQQPLLFQFPKPKIKQEKLTPNKYREDVYEAKTDFEDSSPLSITDLRSEVEDMEKQGAIDEYLESYAELPRNYVLKYYHNTDGEPIDQQYGLKLDQTVEKWYLGNSEVKIDKNDIIVNNVRYEGTPGLYELLFMEKPRDNLITSEDVINYRNIAKFTNLFKKNFDSKQGIPRNIGKYNTYIKKPKTESTSSSSSRPITRQRKLSAQHGGSGFVKTFNKSKKEYIYFDNFNELVNRLRLLFAAEKAGNNSVNNEIISIIEELKEANIIE